MAHPDWVVENTVVYKPFKGRKSNKVVKMPLSEVAKEILNDSITENARTTAFVMVSEQAANRIFKKVAAQLEITANIHFHIARESFATNYLENGGKLEVLQVYMGHERITTTMKYVKIREQLKQAEVSKVDQMFTRPIKK